GEIWWPALLSVGAAVVVTAIALRVLDHRDIGAGVLPSRPGPARAGAGLGGCLGLAWRLQRGSLAGWGVALLLIGLAYGSIGTDVGDLIGDSPQAAEMFAQTGGGLVDSFYSTTALMMALIGSGYAVQAALRLRTEEAAGRVEPILATRVPRARWVASHLLVALAGSAVVVALGGLGTGLAYGLTSGDASQIARLLGASLVHVPAVWVLVGLTVALVALVPRWASLAWAALAFCFVMMMFGALLRLPGWLVDLSPFTHMPLLPVEDPAAAPLVATAIAAAVLCAIGLGGFARRDVQT
ncbi:MAG: ABC transporter permease, partial [Nocardioidaceae bacterium]